MTGNGLFLYCAHLYGKEAAGKPTGESWIHRILRTLHLCAETRRSA